MRYWWVNQNQTYQHEVGGNYLWSPKRNANGHRNPSYDFMREVAPGDVVFSFADALIKAISIPPDRGIFLRTTYRMHADVCGFISEAVYDGRLHPEPDNQ